MRDEYSLRSARLPLSLLLLLPGPGRWRGGLLLPAGLRGNLLLGLEARAIAAEIQAHRLVVPFLQIQIASLCASVM